MIIHQLTPDECRDVLRLASVARLACARADQPYVVPIFVYFDEREDCLYGFSAVGQKIDWMRENPKVCVEVERIVDKFHWSTVVVFGMYEEVGISPDEAAARHRASELFDRRPQWWLPAAGKLGGHPEHAEPVVYRIRIARLTGRRAERSANDADAP